jgi:ABC-type multidrug transport system fused ATPase/permease subunit
MVCRQTTLAQFDNASVRYAQGLPDVLHSLSIELPKRVRCGVVGATGCGKSSLTLALLRIIDTHEGAIYVDGRDLASTDLETVRRRLTLVPQGACHRGGLRRDPLEQFHRTDPVLFSGRVRENLDPLNEHEDAELWEAIKATGFYRDGDEDHGLDAQVSAGGGNMSQGALAPGTVRPLPR